MVEPVQMEHAWRPCKHTQDSHPACTCWLEQNRHIPLPGRSGTRPGLSACIGNPAARCLIIGPVASIVRDVVPVECTATRRKRGPPKDKFTVDRIARLPLFEVRVCASLCL